MRDLLLQAALIDCISRVGAATARCQTPASQTQGRKNTVKPYDTPICLPNPDIIGVTLRVYYFCVVPKSLNALYLRMNITFTYHPTCACESKRPVDLYVPGITPFDYALLSLVMPPAAIVAYPRREPVVKDIRSRHVIGAREGSRRSGSAAARLFRSYGMPQCGRIS